MRSAALPLAVLAAVLSAALAGCAPKRVVDGRAIDGDLPPRSARAARTRPAPDERPADVTPGNVTLGVRAAELAQLQLGKPYQWGASGPDRFDCSGLVMHVFGELGLDLPRVAREQAEAGRPVDFDNLQAGDLVFFAIDGGDIDHVGIYVGGSEFVHAPRTSVPVSTESFHNSWWRQRYRKARRLG